MWILLFILVIFVFVCFITKRNKRTESKRYISIDDKFNSSKVETQNKIDVLLDKVSKYGYESLTKKEKDFLNKYSKK